MGNEYTFKTYETAKIFLDARWYTRKEVEAMLEWFNQMDKQLEAAMKETK